MNLLLAGLVPGLPEATVATIVARADGIPLYAVETVRMLLADGQLVLEDGAYRPIGDLTDLAVPATLTALIASRLDGLAPADRALVCDAAVLGQSFTRAGLRAVSGRAEDELDGSLRTLVRRELIILEADPRSPERGQYAFVQALVREVAYNTLSKRDRKLRHLAAARFFEALDSDELAGALAGHYLAAYQNAGDGAEAEALAAQARITLRAAAERAIDLRSWAKPSPSWTSRAPSPRTRRSWPSSSSERAWQPRVAVSTRWPRTARVRRSRCVVGWGTPMRWRAPSPSSAPASSRRSDMKPR